MQVGGFAIFQVLNSVHQLFMSTCLLAPKFRQRFHKSATSRHVGALKVESPDGEKQLKPVK